MALDFPGRVKSLIPGGWFSGFQAPVRDGLIGGIGDVLKWVGDQGAIVRAATRLSGATGWLLDLAAWDFFGDRFLRRAGELDDPWRARIVAELLRPRVTRVAISQAVTDLVGVPPRIREPWNPGDCGAYNVGTAAYAGALAAPTLAGYDSPIGGYGSGTAAYVSPLPANAVVGSSRGAGCFGTLALPNQYFIDVQRPPLTGAAFAGGNGFAFHNAPTTAYTRRAIEPQGVVSDEEIYRTIAEVTAAGVTAWVRIVNHLPS